MVFLSFVLIIWTTFWKAKALWRSAKNNQVYIFILLMLVNTLGVLEIVYLRFFQKNMKYYILFNSKISKYFSFIKNIKILK
jgi:methionyl-tRNA synthetase